MTGFDVAKPSDDEVVDLYRSISSRAIAVLSARDRDEMDAARAAGQVYVAHYSRYHRADDEEFLALGEAVSFLAYGSDSGNLAYERITGPDGFVMDGAALSDAIDNVQTGLPLAPQRPTDRL